MGPTNLSMYATLSYLLLFIFWAQKIEGKPRLKSYDVQDYFQDSPDVDSLLTDLVRSWRDKEDTTEHLPNSLVTLYSALSKLHTKHRNKVSLNRLIHDRPHNERMDSLPRKPDYSLFGDMPSPGKREVLEGILPPMAEFCRMLGMGNCWRYKRSTPDLDPSYYGSAGSSDDDMDN